MKSASRAALALPVHAWHERRVDNNRASGTGERPPPPG